jgi:heme-degrading monooxygenase HmoA
MPARGLRPTVVAMHALVVTYGLGVTQAEHAELSSELAPALDAVPGLVSRTRLENRDTGRYGVFYIFESKAAFDRFVASELYGSTYGAPRTTGLTASDFAIPNGGRTS